MLEGFENYYLQSPAISLPLARFSAGLTVAEGWVRHLVHGWCSVLNGPSPRFCTLLLGRGQRLRTLAREFSILAVVKSVCFSWGPFFYQSK